MKNKKKTKKTKKIIEKMKQKARQEAEFIIYTGILGVIFLLCFIGVIELNSIYSNLKIQTETLIQISDFLQNRFEIEKPSEQMVELEEIK